MRKLWKLTKQEAHLMRSYPPTITHFGLTFGEIKGGATLGPGTLTIVNSRVWFDHVTFSNTFVFYFLSHSHFVVKVTKFSGCVLHLYPSTPSKKAEGGS
ncbi:unnamed protein product [Lactuca virosa]|uniref:Uncharacterized protein n=1 Tax=Lactuca virosa TaxID=75947 RepID=A0AAU9NMG4_9ASTR|nr:unnamed protein product [Lactuca virosa]